MANKKLGKLRNSLYSSGLIDITAENLYCERLWWETHAVAPTGLF